MQTGRCECGAVQYRLQGALCPSIACHCGQCRRTSGHYWSANQVDDDQLKITKDDGLVWYRSSDVAARGFCSTGGSSLFWRMDGEGKTSIGSGTLGGPTRIETAKHISAGDKCDYYKIEDGVPQIGQY
ncbi:MAG: GFA family protein [Pseudomonadota bacterium]